MNRIFTHTSICIFSFALLLGSCSVPEAKSPEFTESRTSFMNGIKETYGFEDVKLLSSSSMNNGKSAKAVGLELKNGKNLPEDLNGMTDAARDIAQNLKNSIRNPQDYEEFTVTLLSGSSQEGLHTEIRATYTFDNEAI